MGSVLVMCECAISAQCIHTHCRQVTGSYADQFSNVIYLALWPHSASFCLHSLFHGENVKVLSAALKETNK